MSERPDVERLTVLASDVSPLCARELIRLAEENESFRFHLVPHLLSENRSGHMASILFRPGTGHRLSGVRPDVVHVIGEAAYLSTRQVINMRRRRWPSAPITLYAAQNVVQRFPFPFPQLEQTAYRSVAHALPITPTALQVLRTKGYSGPATVVPLGVDTRLFQRCATPDADQFTVGFVGRLEPHKGIKLLLRARQILGCRLLLVGDGSMRGEIEEASKRDPGTVELCPWTDHARLPAVLSRMDALALPSLEVIQRNLVPWIGIPLREQFGRVLVEAMACGVPVVGSDTGDIPHVIGSAGLVFPSGDATALAEQLASIRDNAVVARSLSKSGLRRASTEFSWHHIAGSLCQTWQQLVDVSPSCRNVGLSIPGQHEAEAPAAGSAQNESIR